MEKFDFDRIIERKQTDCYKWDGLAGDMEVLPMWVADMDFACAPAITAAVLKRAAHPVYGYPVRAKRYFDAVTGWFSQRHNFQANREHLAFAPPGVIYAMNTLLKLLTKEGDKVLVHVPNYDPLFDIVTKNRRILVESPLIEVDGQFQMDFDDFEQKAKEGLSAILITSPHNPTGRVWTREELCRIAEICLAHDVFMLVDEIHADFTNKAHPHTAFGTLGQEAMQKSAVCYSANKGFNLGGFAMSTIVIANDELRGRFAEEMGTAQTRLDNIFGAEAMMAAYTQGGEWLDAAIAYVDENKNHVRTFLSENIPEIRWTDTEGTYFGWLDCEALGLSGEALSRFMLEEAKIAFSPGCEFGPGGENFLRMNLACPKVFVEKALLQMKKAVDERHAAKQTKL